MPMASWRVARETLIQKGYGMGYMLELYF
jgi:hypothetical protein